MQIGKPRIRGNLILLPFYLVDSKALDLGIKDISSGRFKAMAAKISKDYGKPVRLRLTKQIFDVKMEWCGPSNVKVYQHFQLLMRKDEDV